MSRVFVSYSVVDAIFAENLASALERADLPVFLYEWDVLRGESTIGRIDEGIRAAESAIVVVSRQAPHDRWVTEEYAALAKRAVDGRLRRLVPVLRDDEVVLPPMLDVWRGVSFADVVDRPGFDRRVDELAADLRSERRTRPVDLSLIVPADRARTPDTPLWTTVRIGASRTTLVTEVAADLSAGHGGITGRVRRAQWQVEHARAGVDRRIRTGSSRDVLDVAPDLDTASKAFGTALADAFLPAPIAEALAGRLAESARSGRAANVAFEVEADLADLPWESVVLAGDTTPLALRPTVRLYRHVAGLGPTALPAIPGPLRILAVISSPDVGGGELLDYEHELARILDQVDQARRKEKAYVRILNWGSVEAIRQALTEEPFHVLHVSCHARPGVLLLETADGAVDEVTARRLTDHLVIPGHLVPLVVLGGCDTSGSAEELPGLARSLIECGVPSVLAMSAPVTDDYATDFLAGAYRGLAAQDSPEPLAAVSDVRRLLEAERLALPPDDRRAGQAEWATPVLHQRVRHNRLFEASVGVEPVVRPVRKGLAHGIVDLAIGDFVGRRVELRKLLRELRDTRGVLIHGMGGVGKSSLAAQLVHLLGEDEPLVVTRHGPCTADQILEDVVKALRRRFGKDWHRDTLDELLDPSEEWSDRLRTLSVEILPSVGARVLLLLDDPVGDPLEVEGRDGTAVEPEPELAAFLDAWLGLSRQVRVVITARYRFEPRRNSRRLSAHHLGPLSEAETRKLVLRLPALDALDTRDRQRAYQALGGHPRAMEYLDAVLRGGRKRAPGRGTGEQFDDVVLRIEQALRVTGERNVRAWWTTAGRDLDHALAETYTITSADVLLDDLLAGLARTFPLAAELFIAASVYRQPVDLQGLQWVVAREPEPADDPARQERLSAIYQALVDAERRGSARSRKDLDLSAEAGALLNRDLAMAARPAERAGLAAACDRLGDLTLLTPVPGEDDDAPARYLVHRWTASSLGTRVDTGDLALAHRRAAAYHRRQAELWRRDLSVRLDELEEARHHSWEAGERGQALAVTAEMCAVLDRLGALDREEWLCERTLELTGPDDPDARVFHHRMSVIAMRRGEHGAAEAAQHRAQHLALALDDLVAVATGLQQLGTIAQLRGLPAAAELRYRAAIRAAGDGSVADRLDARVVLAGCYQRLGGLALARGDEEEADRFSVGALEVAEEIGDETDSVTIHADLAEIARACGDHEAAERHGLRAQEVAAADVDMRRLIAAAALQLGAACLTRGMFDEAAEHLDDALEFAEQAQDVPLHATCLRLVGEVLFHEGEYDRARSAFERYVLLAELLEDRRGEAVAYQQLGRIWGVLGDLEAARDSLRTATRLAEGLDSDLLVGTSALTLGGVLAAAGDLGGATRVLTDGLRIAERVSENGLAMGCVVQLALVRLRDDDMVGAQALFLSGIRRAQEVGSRRGEAVCQVALGLIARALGQEDEAADLYEAALDLAEEEGNPRVAAECLTRMADLALDDSRVSQAEELYGRSLEILDVVRAPHLRAEVLRQRGRCFADRADHPAAADALRAAGGAFALLERPVDVAICLVHLAWVLPLAGERAAAREVMHRVGRIVDGQPPSLVVVVALIVAGDGALAGDDLDTATNCFETARATAHAIRRRSLLADCACRLAAVARRRADPSEVVRQLEAGLAIARHQRDHVLTCHLHRELGLVTGTRAHLVESAVAAYDLGEKAAYAAAQLLLDTEPDRDVLDAALAAASDELDALLWLRRRRAVDGEVAFGDRVVSRAGPSIDEIVRDLAPLPSGVTNVPAVVSPSVR